MPKGIGYKGRHKPKKSMKERFMPKAPKPTKPKKKKRR
jgi:hypothetical protein